MIIRRYREGVPDSSLISHDLDFLHETLDKRPSFRGLPYKQDDALFTTNYF
jgi:hypothetical protein